jgi:hypothetical protein
MFNLRWCLGNVKRQREENFLATFAFDDLVSWSEHAVKGDPIRLVTNAALVVDE